MNISAMPKWMLPTIMAVIAIVIAFLVLTGSRRFQQSAHVGSDEAFETGVPDILARSENAQRSRVLVTLQDPQVMQREELSKRISEIASRAKGDENVGNRGVRQLEEIALEKSQPEAMMALGDLFASEGFKGYSNLKAYTWYTLAAGFRAEGALDKRLRMAELLSEKELEKGQSAAEKLLDRMKNEGK